MSIIIMFRKHLFKSESEKNDRMKIHHLFIAASAAALLAGCAGADARRQQRWAAFEPLRPAPEFRLLPDRPLLKFHRTAGTVPADSKPGEVYSEPPARLEKRKTRPARHRNDQFEIFPGSLCALRDSENRFHGEAPRLRPECKDGGDRPGVRPRRPSTRGSGLDHVPVPGELRNQ